MIASAASDAIMLFSNGTHMNHMLDVCWQEMQEDLSILGCNVCKSYGYMKSTVNLALHPIPIIAYMFPGMEKTR